MNFLEKLLWRWQSKAKLNHPDDGLRYTAVSRFGEVSRASDLEILLELLMEPSQTIRNAAVRSTISLLQQFSEDTVVVEELMGQVFHFFEKQRSLTVQLALIEVMKYLPLDKREEVLGPLVLEREDDMRYAIIKSLKDTQELSILDDVLQASDTADLVLRRMAFETWYEGIATQNIEDITDYTTPRLHYLIRAAFELQTDGELLRKALSYAEKSNIPSPKAYPDFMIRYITELLNSWEYDPDAFRSLHAIMVPSYFTFDTDSGSDERPYVVL